MKLSFRIFLLGIAFLFVGCPVRSIFPLFTEKDLFFDPALIGKWQVLGSDPPDTVSVTASATEYLVHNPVLHEGSQTSYHQYSAKLGRIGAHVFLDTYQELSPNHDAQDHMILAHQFHRITLRGDTLELSSLDDDWLRKMIDGGALPISHVRRDGEIILTASTQDLQAFVLRYADDPGAFAKTAVYIKVK